MFFFRDHIVYNMNVYIEREAETCSILHLYFPYKLMNISFHFHSFMHSAQHIKPPSDMNSWTAMLPSFEFMNFVFALIVWSSRYPSVYWSTSKAFALIFSIQMIVNAIDLLLVFAGVSVIYKLQIVGQKLPLQVSFPFFAMNLRFIS